MTSATQRVLLGVLLLAAIWPIPAATASPASAPPAAVEATVPAALTGTWRVASGSSAGYRFTADTFLIGPSTVTGRTSTITGSATVRLVTGRERLTAAQFSVDLRTLRSGSSLYDGQVSSLLETARYPIGLFVLRAPATMPSEKALAAGTTITMYGYMTLHGVRRAVSLPARLLGTARRMTVSGSVPIRLSDYGVANRAAGGLTTIDDQGSFDFRVVFTR